MERRVLGLMPIPRFGRRMTVLLAAFLVLAALTIGAGHAPDASAQTTYTIPITYGAYGGYGYGNYGYGYGSYGYPYGSNYGYGYPYGYNSSYSYPYGYGSSYPFSYNYLNPYNYGYSNYAYNSVPVNQTSVYSGTGSGLAVGVSWRFCTGPNGPVWVPAGASTVGLFC